MVEVCIDELHTKFDHVYVVLHTVFQSLETERT